MFEVLRRLVSDSYKAKSAGMSAGLPRVYVDASQLKHLLDHYDAQLERIRTLEAGIEREAARYETEAAMNYRATYDLEADDNKERAARLRALLESTCS